MQILHKELNAFLEEYDLNMSAQNWFNDLVSELGEVAKELNRLTEYGRKDFKKDGQLVSEVGDLFYSLLGFCAEINIDLNECFKKTLARYKKRYKKTGNIGSGII